MQQNSYQINDLIVFDSGERGDCVKRVLAGPGDTILLRDGIIWRNGIKFSDYTCELLPEQKYFLKEGMYFVIGDNFNASIDSRNYGPVAEENILGKVILY
jgi:signal peptidase I